MRKLTNLTLMTIALFCLEHPAAAQLQGAPVAHQFQSDFDAQIRHYQLKSRRQKTLAWILLGGGFGVSMLAPTITNDNTGTSNDAGGTEVLAAISSGAVIASIPLFFASSANRDLAQMVFFKSILIWRRAIVSGVFTWMRQLIILIGRGRLTKLLQWFYQ